MHHKISRRVLARTVAANMLANPKQASHWIKVVAAYLLENNLADDADLVISDIERELFVQGGQLNARVTTARPMSDHLRNELTQFLTQATKAKRVVVSEQIDASLVGGLVARTPDGELDLSVRRQLNQLAAMTTSD
ncbi:MAG TPA: F0F1 ATP synthase subunit delta [Candidatus Saccharimonadales bacterium]|jgi:F0F1-type ATP synthase delta subunit|nr:F0F1 ATP synthase subunit delta [Candidatus Saccharimonadales bacterium]